MAENLRVSVVIFDVVALVLVVGQGVRQASTIAAHSQDKTITVFAAASMKNALDDFDEAFTTRTGVKVVASYDASSALMKQIEGATRPMPRSSPALKSSAFSPTVRTIRSSIL